MAWNVLILGGGFGGMSAARRLERLLPAHSARVTLVNDVNFMLYTPLLPGAAGGTLEPRHVVVPLREELRSTDLRVGHVLSGDPERQVVRIRAADGHEVDLPYDQLVVALGAVSRTLPVPGLAEHAIGLKTLSEGIALRNQLIHALEKAEAYDDPKAREALLTFVFVGGGYAGLEGIAELQDFAADVLDLYPRCRVQGLRFVLVEARERVMLEIGPQLAGFAQAQLRARGIEFRTNTTVERVSADSVELSNGEIIPTRTVCWTAGVKPPPVVGRLGLPLSDGGRLRCDQYLRVEGHQNVWAIGDAAGVPDPAKPGRPCPPTAQHAIRQGKVVADNVARALGDGTRRPRAFRYKTKGVVVDMGRHQAVAETMGIRWRGFPAWWITRTYHLAMMPGGTKRRIRLVTDWTVGLVFGRDSSELGQLGHPPPLAEPEGPQPQVGPASAPAPSGETSPKSG